MLCVYISCKEKREKHKNPSPPRWPNFPFSLFSSIVVPLKLPYLSHLSTKIKSEPGSGIYATRSFFYTQLFLWELNFEVKPFWWISRVSSSILRQGKLLPILECVVCSVCGRLHFVYSKVFFLKKRKKKRGPKILGSVGVCVFMLDDMYGD